MPCCFRGVHWLGLDETGCQFNVPEAELFQFNDLIYCCFHLPMAAPDSSPSPKVEWNRTEIEHFNREIFMIIDRANGTNDRADLAGVVFPGEISFARYSADNPLPEISFHGSTFSGNAKFVKVAFSGDLVFVEAKFFGSGDFHSAAFADPVFFEDTTFSKHADFADSTFSKSANFYYIRFTKHALFLRTEFAGEIQFLGATFVRDAIFNEVRFCQMANFGNTTFDMKADFGRATFHNHAYFRDSQFNGITDFALAEFSQSIHFQDAAFSDFASFRETAFSGRINFEKATFSRGADFSGFAVPGNADVGKISATNVTTAPTPDRASFRSIRFADATFGGVCDFNNRRFLDTTAFQGTAFTKAPKFHNAVLHQDTDFTGAKFLDTSSEDAARNYGTLRSAMETLRKRNEEAMFFAYEQRSLRQRPDTPWAARWVSKIYDWTADYGCSIARPLLCMLAVLAVFWLLYFSCFAYVCSVKTTAVPLLSSAVASVTFAFEQVFRPFAVWSQGYDFAKAIPEVEIMPGWRLLFLKVMATVHSLITIGLFTLFLLALRKRFRMI